MDESAKESLKFTEEGFKNILQAYCSLVNQYVEDMRAIEHELETIWEAINELQGIDPAKAGEPN